MATRKTKKHKGGRARKAVAATTAPRAKAHAAAAPEAGATIVRPYKGKDITVKVTADGFEYDGTPYRSLTAIARVVTGAKAISGPWFFRLPGTQRAKASGATE